MRTTRLGGLRAVSALLVAAVIPAVVLLANAQPGAAQPQTPPASQPAPDRAAAAAAQAAALEKEGRAVEARWLLDISRSLQPVPLPGQPAVPLWQLDRRMLLLVAAGQISDSDPSVNLELSLARADCAVAYRQLSQEATQAAAKAKAAGTSDQAEQFAQIGTLSAKRSADYQSLVLDSLARYVAATPHDLPVWQTLLLRKLELLQTADERITFLQGELTKVSAATQPAGGGSLPGQAERVSTIQTLLASLMARQGRTDEVEPLLRAALSAMPLNRAARAQLLDRLGGKATPTDALELGLTDLRLSPANVNTAAWLSSFLARYGLYEAPVTVTVAGASRAVDRGAIGMLEYEAALRREGNESAPVPAELLFRLGEAQLLAGQAEGALRTVRQAIAQSETGLLTAGAGDPMAPLPAINLPARVLLIEALKKVDPRAATTQADAIVRYYASHRSKTTLTENPALTGVLSWFYLTVREDPKTAADLARLAVRATPDDPVAKLSLGAALSADATSAKEAVSLLEPLIRQGLPWSVYYAAQAHRTLGATTQADDLLTTLATAWPGNMAGRAARVALGSKAPPAPSVDALRDRMAQLPQGLFDYHRAPGAVAAVALRVLSGESPYEPVAIEVGLVNRSGPLAGAAGGAPANPGFPVTFGEDLMVWPSLLVSAAVQLPGEKAPRIFRTFCRYRLASPQVLNPGEGVSSISTIDIGPVGQLLRLTPQADKTITISLMVNPVERDGQWVPGPGGYTVEQQFVRKAMPVDSEAVREIAEYAKTGTPRAKLTASRALGSLLAEQQLAPQLSYKPRSVAVYRITDPLSAVCADPDPGVRAFWADAIYPAGVTGKPLEAAVKNLSDASWLVRLLAVRLLGERMGRTYQKEITRVAVEDADPLLRQFAQTYIDQWNAEKK